ncbi:MAG: type I-A CRISPR-associated protein Cas4/Csa1 [Dehalococcoidia bacterium]|nr:type I-A CRISPR-associated protein Cas4/Csa1 [Dehalococcoidia bacterium]
MQERDGDARGHVLLDALAAAVRAPVDEQVIDDLLRNGLECAPAVARFPSGVHLRQRRPSSEPFVEGAIHRRREVARHAPAGEGLNEVLVLRHEHEQPRGDLEAVGVAPGGPRGLAEDGHGLRNVGRGEPVQDDAVGEFARQAEHARAQRRDEERRLVLRRLLPEARRREVASELRGWSWDQAPLAPVYSGQLAMYEVASGYCTTSRDVYLRRVVRAKAEPTPAMIAGAALHRVVAELVLAAKRAIYSSSGDILETLASLAQPDAILAEWAQDLTLQEQARTLWRFEHNRVVARVEDTLSRQPYVGPDSLVASALPVIVEHKLNGSFLGLSPYLSTDAFVFSEPMVVDLKFGPRQAFDRLTTTGYALVMESINECPVNIGCIVYVRFKEERVLIERDFHIIDDELRQWFIEVRDEKARLVEEEIDPGLPADCYEQCQYLRTCRG